MCVVISSSSSHLFIVSNIFELSKLVYETALHKCHQKLSFQTRDADLSRAFTSKVVPRTPRDAEEDPVLDHLRESHRARNMRSTR